MKYIKYFESDTFVIGDIVSLKYTNKEPFEIIDITTGPAHEGSKKYHTLCSLIRNFKRNWTLDKDIISLTEKEKENIKIELNRIKYNL
jgi:hypothetical protein